METPHIDMSINSMLAPVERNTMSSKAMCEVVGEGCEGRPR